MSTVAERQRQMIGLVVVILCVSALYAIVTILGGDEFDEDSARVIVSASALAVFMLLGLAGRSVMDAHPHLAWLGWLTILVAVGGLIVTLMAVWVDWAWDGENDYWQPALILLTYSIALGHTSLLLRGAKPNDADAVVLLRAGTIIAALLLATFLSAAVSKEGDGPADPEATAVVAILYVLGILLMPLVRRMTPLKPAPDHAGAVVPNEAHVAAAVASSPPSSRGATGISIRPAYASDAEAIAAIYNQGIEERQATFQTRPHDSGELELKTEQRGGQLIVAERDDEVIGWASWVGYDDPADYYAGIAECTVYVGRDARREGVGAELLEGLAAEAPKFGVHKLVAKIFTTNAGSIELFRRRGFREVGTHLRHGRLDGEWKDVLVMERLLTDA